MSKLTRVVLAIVFVCVVGAVWAGWNMYVLRVHERARAGAYKREVAQFVRTYPNGTPRAVVEKGLDKPAGQGEIDLLLGTDSGGLVCKSWNTYAVFTFMPSEGQDRLSSIKLTANGSCL